jgi:hypothetical protein
MAEVLNEAEIDKLFPLIDTEYTGTDDLMAVEDFGLNLDSDYDKKPLNIESLEAFLSERKFKPDTIYGTHSFQKSVTMCRFFESKDNENILADIEQKNAEQNMGNIVIPNTKIKLINYSVCPKCKSIFSFKDLMVYYKNPKPDPEYKNRGEQLREDTRVCCSECGEYFLPALVISDGIPKNEVQFLCRMQTVDAVERFFMEKGQHILSRNKNNILKENNYITVHNDVDINQMVTKPTLISNMLQYTPANLLPNFIDGSNVEKGDILFGKWNPVFY